MLLVYNGYIKTMAGADLEKGCVLIGDDGKILSVAEKIDPPESAVCIDAGGRLVTPGCVDAHCHLGMRDDYNESADPLTPQLRAIDAIYPQSEVFADAIGGGVTAVCVGPGSANVVCGTFAAIKCVGKRIDDMIIKNPIGMKCAFGENPRRFHGEKGRSPATRMGIAAMLRELLFKTCRYKQDKDTGKNPAFDMKLEAMLPVIEGKIPLKAHAHRADDIFTAIRIAKEFGVGITLDHCTDGALIAEELAKEGLPAFVGPSFGYKTKRELQNKSFTTPRILHEAGVPISIISDHEVVPIEYLTLYAGLAVKSGLDKEAAWRAITINPAVYTGIGDRIGSLEPGKDGDVVIWAADPLDVISSGAWVTIVDGKVVYRAE